LVPDFGLLDAGAGGAFFGLGADFFGFLALQY